MRLYSYWMFPRSLVSFPIDSAAFVIKFPMITNSLSSLTEYKHWQTWSMHIVDLVSISKLPVSSSLDLKLLVVHLSSQAPYQPLSSPHFPVPLHNPSCGL